MGEMHTVRLEPVGIEFEVDEDETVLNGAFRQGLMLMHGCKEGQCAACKSFLLDGEVDLDRYSTFALPEFEERRAGRCCAAPTRSPISKSSSSTTTRRSCAAACRCSTLQTRVVAVEELTHDIRRLVLEVTDGESLTFHPGQYVDISIPGEEGHHRSFSMANTPDRRRARWSS